MKELVIYGIGNGFRKINFDMFWKFVINQGYFIEHILDGNIANEGKKVYVQNRAISVEKSQETFWDEKPEVYVYITANNFFEEIHYQLINMGVKESQILEDDLLWDKLLCEMFSAEYWKGNGIEIGGPSSVFGFIYNICESCDDIDFSTETVWNIMGLKESYKLNDGKILGKRYIADATDLSFIGNESYDFILSSNNIEHIANPLKALKEWVRILKTDGYMLLILPNKKYNFDHNREDTTWEHILEDYEKDITEHDMTHLEEILKFHDLSMDINISLEEFELRSQNNYENRCLHHHVFSCALLEQIATYLGLKIKDVGEIFDNYYMIVQK